MRRVRPVAGGSGGDLHDRELPPLRHTRVRGRPGLPLAERLGERAFAQAWEQGGALAPEEAVAYASRGRGGRRRPSAGWAALTRTETEVARLVAEGLRNKEIADRLCVSPRTVQTHLSNTFTKLGLTSRAQLTQEVVRHRTTDPGTNR